MVALDAIGAITPGPMSDAGHSRGESWSIAGGLVGDDPAGCRPSRSDGPFEEGTRRHHVSGRCDIRVDNLTTAVNGAINVVPTAADASVGLVDSPIEPDRLA